jgi:hypothetical protein
MSRDVRKLKVLIERPAGEAYEFLSLPENFRKWASGAGANEVRFCERNARGVLDHSVRTPEGAEVYVPLRVLPKGRRCELELTLFRPPQMTDERFAADSEWVMRDLLAAKRLLENRS